MTKGINVSDEAYEWLLKMSSTESIKNNKKISIADILDVIIKKEGNNEKRN